MSVSVSLANLNVSKMSQSICRLSTSAVFVGLPPRDLSLAVIVCATLRMFFLDVLKNVATLLLGQFCNIPIAWFFSSSDNLYYYKTLGLCMYVCLFVPNRPENHLMILDILWHTVSLDF